MIGKSFVTCPYPQCIKTCRFWRWHGVKDKRKVVPYCLLYDREISMKEVSV